MTTTITLRREFFTEREHELVRASAGTVSAFAHASGVPALRVVTDRVELTWLPFDGSQVWRFAVDGEDLTMVTPFDEPTGTPTFFGTYGPFLMHCGLEGMGHPGPTDAHPHHGELPVARFQRAWVEVGQDDRGAFVALAGTYAHRSAAAYTYDFTPRLVLRPGSPVVELTYTIHNHRATPLRYQYLCHLNWTIFPGATLVQSAPMDASGIEFYPDARQDAALAAYMAGVIEDPASSNAIDPALPLMPEYCAVLTPRADADGWAHFLQTRPDGRAAWVGFETTHLPHVVRWLQNTGDELAAGFCMPATSHHKGRTRAEAQGMIAEVGPRGSVTVPISFGLLDADAAASTAALIDSLLT